ncbi:hypothetical protein M2138_000272 [Dysgonomonadaceae bacterium PH5-43]|nr:hypothetical protein [Dysgonomonadaceae bacterium PH5-43]
MNNITNTYSVLDFDENGCATIEIPQVQSDYSFILNHWQNSHIQIDEIERDLLYTDSEERKLFLEKSKKTLLNYQKYFLNDYGDYAEDTDLITTDEIHQELQDSDYALSEEEKAKWDDIFESDIDWDWDWKEDKDKINTTIDTAYNDEDNSQYLIVRNFKLKHSLAWYLMNRIEEEIIKVKKEIEGYRGILKILKNDDTKNVIDTIKMSRNTTDAYNQLMQKFNLSEIQANMICNMILQRFTSLLDEEVIEIIEEYVVIQSFLEKLKE